MACVLTQLLAKDIVRSSLRSWLEMSQIYNRYCLLLHNEVGEIEMVRLSVEALTLLVVRGVVSNFVTVGVKDKSQDKIESR